LRASYVRVRTQRGASSGSSAPYSGISLDATRPVAVRVSVLHDQCRHGITVCFEPSLDHARRLSRADEVPSTGLRGWQRGPFLASWLQRGCSHKRLMGSDGPRLSPESESLSR
jgi:hypothetical protein